MSALILTEALAAKTRPVFELLSKQTALDAFVLVGGTAMALQLQHRQSEDIDLWLPAEQLSPYVIDRLMRDLQSQGHSVVFATPSAGISSFRINTGLDLRRHVQDWVVDGVKVQFLCPQDVAFDHFRKFPRLPRETTNTSFEVMGLAGIFSMKAYVIHRRTRSRDLVDLWHFLQNGKTIDNILSAGADASPSISADYAKSVLRGEVPLDASDEGFELLRPGLTLGTIYADFSREIDAFEIEQARQVMLGRNAR